MVITFWDINLLYVIGFVIVKHIILSFPSYSSDIKLYQYFVFSDTQTHITHGPEASKSNKKDVDIKFW